MRVPLEWLKQYVDFDDTAKGLADKLTFSGIEVEGIETTGADYTGLIVAEVRAVERHPNADRLTVCRVFDGTAEVQVVCGAPNVKAGGFYPFAPEGSTLPGGTRIKPAKLRGIESHGMLCAEDELAVSDDHSGLMELKGGHPAGTPLRDVLGGPETVLDLEITPNRPDCLCLMGVAREVAALYGLALRRPPVALAESAEPVDTLARVEILDPELCPRYTARVIRNVRIAPSPAWMQRRLTLAGIRPINNVVDVTNYVMLECGQPLHAFDYELLAEHRIVVRRAGEGEVMATLDAQERKLASSMLVIADAARAVAVAGVMGGAGSEIRDQTTTVLLESAKFKSSSVRATSKSLGLTTESSYRFARGVDTDGVEWASRRAAALLAELAGGTVAQGVVDAYPGPVGPRAITGRCSAIARLLGMPVARAEVVRVLRALELGVADGGDDDVLQVTVPPFRGDLQTEVDLIEEFARIHGLDRIPARTPRASIVEGANDGPARAASAVRGQLAGLGLNEIMNYSLTSPALLNRFGRGDEAARIRLPNPLSEEQSILRTSLLPQLVETLGRNRAHQIKECAFFEFGRAYALDAAGRAGETARVSIGLMGAAGRGPLQKRAPLTAQETFLWLKGILEDLARVQRLGTLALVPLAHEAMEAGRAFRMEAGGAALGVCGLLRPPLAAEWRIYEPVAVAELDLAPLLAHAGESIAPKPPPAFPSSARDVAFVVAKSVRHEDVVACIRNAVPAAELEHVEIFDIYEGKGIGEGRKSMAYSLTFRSGTRTLTDEEVNAFHQQVTDALVRELKAEIRVA